MVLHRVGVNFIAVVPAFQTLQIYLSLVRGTDFNETLAQIQGLRAFGSLESRRDMFRKSFHCKSSVLLVSFLSLPRSYFASKAST
jgi:hypothetical protein